jgi:hypothetical protein
LDRRGEAELQAQGIEVSGEAGVCLRRREGRMPFGPAGCHPAPQSGKPQTNKIVCAGQEAGLTIPRRMPSGPTATAQIVAAREEMNI